MPPITPPLSPPRHPLMKAPIPTPLLRDQETLRATHATITSLPPTLSTPLSPSLPNSPNTPLNLLTSSSNSPISTSCSSTVRSTSANPWTATLAFRILIFTAEAAALMVLGLRCCDEEVVSWERGKGVVVVAAGEEVVGCGDWDWGREGGGAGRRRWVRRVWRGGRRSNVEGGGGWMGEGDGEEGCVAVGILGWLCGFLSVFWVWRCGGLSGVVVVWCSGRGLAGLCLEPGTRSRLGGDSIGVRKYWLGILGSSK